MDLCESTKLAVTRGDAFAMGITNKEGWKVGKGIDSIFEGRRYEGLLF